MRPQQLDWMAEGTIKALFLDSTHSTNMYGMQLFIGARLLQDRAVPIFFFLCTVDPEQEYETQV